MTRWTSDGEAADNYFFDVVYLILSFSFFPFCIYYFANLVSENWIVHICASGALGLRYFVLFSFSNFPENVRTVKSVIIRTANIFK